jgi:hypothetical protein
MGMKVAVADTVIDYRPWTPGMGTVFEKTYAWDTETARIDEERPWLTPPYVLGAAGDGERGYFITREHAPAFFAAHPGVPVAMHSASFDLDVIHTLSPGLDIYRLVDQDKIWDSQLLHRLYTLATEGHTASGKGQSTLERCAALYLGVELPKDLVDTRGKPVRTSYGQWLGRDPREIEPIYLEYLAKDVVVTYRLYRRLRKLLKARLRASTRAWGFVSADWLEDQMRRWGPSTHHIQLRAAIVLRAITANGLHLDLEHRDDLLRQVRAVAEEQRAILHGHGYIPGQEGSGKALQSILKRLEHRHRGRDFPRTPTGQYATSEDALAALADVEPFVQALLAYRAVEKLQSAFLGKMGKPVLHPSFDVLKTTGRTSSFGDLNSQNLPRDDRVRRCFVPAPGHAFIDADYTAIEMVTLAQALRSQFGLDSGLAEALNVGRDPHTMVAALATGKTEDAVTKEERQRAKPINFGKPGAMGHDSLQAYALASYGVQLSDAEVRQLSEAWFTQFPEMKEFLRSEKDLGLEVARFFDLTPETYCEHTGSRKFLDHPDAAGRGRRPSPILGGMCLKTLRQSDPRTRDGRPYDAGTIDYFWTQVSARLPANPCNQEGAILARRPSMTLQRAVMGLVDREPVWTLTGRLRARATFSARHNNIFQGLAADGAKAALWKVWRAGYRVANFIHDELLVEVPAESDLGRHARRIRRLMVEGMGEVVADVRVAVEYAATTVWSKRAEKVTDERGRLVAWSPQEEEACHATAS